jgi:hypothetical protein
MTTKSLAAARVLAFWCVLSASCLQATPDADSMVSPAPSTERVSEPSSPETLGVAPQPMAHLGHWFGSKDFPFEDWIPDDGTDAGGGCQRSVTSLGFAVLHGTEVVYPWDCPIEIDVPKRTKLLGKITASRASLWTTQAANLVAPLLMDSREPDEWRGQGEVYCKELYPRLQSLMNAQHKGLGARVHRP